MVILLVEAGDASIRIAQVERARGRVTIVKDATFELPQQLRDGGFVENLAWFTRILSSSLDGEGFSHDSKMILTLGDSLVRSKAFVHPPTKPQVLKSFAVIEAENILRGNTEDYVVETLTYNDKPDADGQIKSILYAVETEVLLKVADALAGVGFDVIKVLPRIASYMESLFALLDAVPELKTKTVAGIDFSDGRAQLGLFVDGEPLFESTYGSVAVSMSKLLESEEAGAEPNAPGIPQVEVEPSGVVALASEPSFSIPEITIPEVEPVVVSGVDSATLDIPEIDVPPGDTPSIPEVVAPAPLIITPEAPAPTGVPRFTPAIDTMEGFLDEVEEAVMAPRYVPGTPLSQRAIAEIGHFVDPAIAEVMRGLRIVLAAERLELDELVVSGAVSELPGFSERISELAGVPCRSIGEYYGSLSGTVRLAPSAQLDPAVFVDSISLVAGSLQKYTQSLDLMALRNRGKRSSTLQTTIMAGATAAALVGMAVLPLNYFLSANQVKSDEGVLSSSAYRQAEQLRIDLASAAEAAKPVEDTSTPLPVGQSRTWMAHRDLYGSLPLSMKKFSYTYDPMTGLVPLSFTITSPEEFLRFQKAMFDSSFFDIAVPLTYSRTIEASETVIQGAVTLRYKSYSPLALALEEIAPAVEAAPVEGGGSE